MNNNENENLDVQVMTEAEVHREARKIVALESCNGTAIKMWLEGEFELTDPEIEAQIKQLKPLDYERKREAIAEKMTVRVSVLDALRPGKREESSGSDIIFPEVMPWPDDVNGAVLLDDLVDTFNRHAVLPPGAAVASALWVVFTYIYEKSDVAPILAVTSPQKRCGKTTKLSILSELVSRPLPASNITSAALFRTIEKVKPTLLIDEFDTFVKDNEELRGVVNSGHCRKLAFVVRAVGDDFEPKAFSTFCPKVLSMIGKLPSTLQDRSIELRLTRKTAYEKTERIDTADIKWSNLRRKLVRWTKDIEAILNVNEVDIPETLNDRAVDNWRPLLAIADCAKFTDESWPVKAREAMALLSLDEEMEIGSLLLADIMAVFADYDTDRLTSEQLRNALIELEEHPWAEWNKGKAISKTQIGRRLKEYGIVSRVFKEDEKSKRGYVISDIAPMADRYCLQSTLSKCNL